MQIASVLSAAAVAVTLSVTAVTAAAASQTSPNQSSSQKVPEASQDRVAGQTLSGQLKQNNGVIHPPSAVDPGAVQAPPPAGPQSTPVIPPPGGAR
jgi:hypothetical protein